LFDLVPIECLGACPLSVLVAFGRKNMSKLSERVFARIKTRSQKSLCHNKATFFALHDEILEAMSSGCSLKAIWETLYEEKKIDFKYRAFLRHAYRFADIMQKVEENRGKKVEKTKSHLIPHPKAKVANRLPPKEIKSNTAMKTFQHNPKSNPEDFI